jgi:hypothetical protein
MVAIKQREEAGLRSRGAFNAAETQIVPRPLNVAEVPEQFLGSDKRSISNNPGWILAQGGRTCNHRVARLPTVVSCAG